MARKTKQQALETRQKILDAALQEFSVRGVSRTSLTDIANTAGVTRGAIYWHFKNKVELFREVWNQIDLKIDCITNQYHEKYPNDPLLVLRRVLEYVLQSVVIDPQRQALMDIFFHKCEFLGEMQRCKEILLQHHQGIDARLEKVLMCCMEKGQLPSSLNIQQGVLLVRAFMDGLMMNWLLSPTSFDLVRQAASFVDVLVESLSSPSICHNSSK